jgi:hypothetical protein
MAQWRTDHLDVLRNGAEVMPMRALSLQRVASYPLAYTSAFRPHPGRSSGCGTILKPAVPRVPETAGLKDRVWDLATISGGIA